MKVGVVVGVAVRVAVDAEVAVSARVVVGTLAGLAEVTRDRVGVAGMGVAGGFASALAHAERLAMKTSAVKSTSSGRICIDSYEKKFRGKSIAQGSAESKFHSLTQTRFYRSITLFHFCHAPNRQVLSNHLVWASVRCRLETDGSRAPMVESELCCHFPGTSSLILLSPALPA